MKRFSLRELLLISAPIFIIAAGLVGSKWRVAQKQAALPRIEGCSIRAPYADEVFQGATRVLTCRGSSPEALQCQPIYTVTNAAGQKFQSQYRSWTTLSIGGMGNGWTENGRRIYTSDTFINPALLHPRTEPTQAEARLYSMGGSNKGQLVAKKSFALQFDGIVVPSLQELRHTTAQIKSVQLYHFSSSAPKVATLKVTLSHPSAQLRSTFNTISRHLNAPDQRLYFDDISSMTESPAGQVLEIDILENYPGPWVKGNKAVLNIAANHEWPLRVEVDFPAQAPTQRVTDLRFRSRLAPIPTKLSAR